MMGECGACRLFHDLLLGSEISARDQKAAALASTTLNKLAR